ncbi:DUF4340 domain-containing protein [Methylomagnum sp.]
MKSRLTLNLVLLAAVGILGALAFFEPGKKPTESTPIATLDENTLTSITLKNKDTVVFGKQDGHWRLTAPFQAPANEIRVQQLIDIAKSSSEADYPVKAEELAKFELDKPKATLILGNSTLLFGGSDPINMRRYVQVGETLHLVNDDFFHHLTAGATDYVDKKLLPETAKVREIQIPGLKASLGQDGKWTREPPGDAAKPDLGELATLWTTARAIDVRRLEAPAQGDTVRIGLAEGNPVEFVVTQKEPDLVLARPDLGLQYELTGETSRQLLNLPKPPQPVSKRAPPPDQDSDEGAPLNEEEDTGELPPEAGEDDSGEGAEAPGPATEESASKPGGGSGVPAR